MQKKLTIALLFLLLLAIPHASGAPTPEILLTSGAANKVCPRWSPDGQWIAYFETEGAAQIRTVCKVPAAGGQVVRLTSDRCPRWHLRWSPDGTWLCAGAEHEVGLFQICKIPAEPGLEIPIKEAGGSATGPEWSPDGGWIAYEAPDSHRVTQIWRVPVNSGPAIQMTSDARLSRDPQWSPDGQWLACIRKSSPEEDSLIKIPVETGTEQVLASGIKDCASLRWSPDGRWIAYGTKIVNGENRVEVLSAEGGPPPDLGSLRHAIDMEWAPGSEWFVSKRNGIWIHRIFPISQTESKDAPKISREISPFDAQFQCCAPVWSPDGRWIAYVRSEPGRKPGQQICKIPFEDEGEEGFWSMDPTPP